MLEHNKYLIIYLDEQLVKMTINVTDLGGNRSPDAVYGTSLWQNRNILARQIWKLQTERWYSLEDAKRIAYSQQVKNGNVKPWTFQLTDQGKQYSWLYSEKRAEMRKQKAAQNRKVKNNIIKSLNNIEK